MAAAGFSRRARCDNSRRVHESRLKAAAGKIARRTTAGGMLYRFTTVRVTAEAYSVEWCTALWATTLLASS